MRSRAVSTDGFSLKRCILDAIFSGLVALIIFGPIAGVVLDGYSFNFAGQRLAWMVGIVMLGRFLLSAFLGTPAGARFQARFDADSAGVYVRPPEYKSRMRWIIPLIIALAICFPFVATKYVLTVAILGLIYVLLGLGLNIVVGLAGLLDLQLQAPRLTLLPERNQLNAVMDLAATGPLLARRYTGVFDVDFGLRYEAQDRSIRAHRLQVNALQLEGLKPQAAALLQRYAQQHIAVQTTPECGAAHWRGLQPQMVQCERSLRPRYWSHAPDR